MGLTNLLWNLGPAVVLLIAVAVSDLGMFGTRIIFAQLFVIAVVTYLLRRGIAESARWKEQAGGGGNPLSFRRLRDLTSRASRRGLAFTAPVFFFWNLAAATNGIFTPYILSTVGGQSQGASVALSALGFLLGLVAVGTVFMPLADSARRRTIFAVGGGLQVVAFLLFVLFPLTTPVAVANVVLFGFGGGMAQFPFIRVWFSELFPTSVRATAQGLVYGGVRLLLFFWSLAVPVIATVGIKPLGLLLAIFLLISAGIGVIFMPDTAGKSLEQIQQEQTGV
jgi:inositol transporter-like SP family MFS transporter